VRYPERVHKLVLSGATPDPRSRTPLRLYAWQMMNMPREPLLMQAIYALDYAQTGVLRMFRTMAKTCNDPIEERLPRVQAETLVLRGRYDAVVRQVWAERMVELLPHGRLIVVSGAAHNAHFTRAAKVAELVSAFIPREAQVIGHERAAAAPA
jgi:pimeloyl-ACP methyl ester carboxylesterase